MIPVRMWVLACPFRKDGVPVVGTFGSRTDTVVIFTIEAWKRLCKDVPALQTTVFDVGRFEDD